MSKWTDGLKDFLSGYANTRAATNRNAYVEDTRLGREQLRAIYKLGVASKIFRLLTSYAINNTMAFDSKEDEEMFNDKMADAFKRAAIFQLGFGRGIVVLVEKGVDLSTPLIGKVDANRVKFEVFSGDEVTPLDVSYDLSNDRYYKPNQYQVRGYSFHWTRVIDLTYFEPIHFEKSNYFYGGISLPELVYNQLINDSVIERASASIVEKNATLFYKIKGFKNALRSKKEGSMLEYFNSLENARSIYGAGLIDEEDAVEVHSQSLSNLKDADDISLRRLALVTGIPLPFLVGENVKGLNSAGDTERDTLNDTVNQYQTLHLIKPLNEFAERMGLGTIKFKESIGMNASEQASYETKVIDNAAKLTLMGEDGSKYLEDKGVITRDPFDLMFPENDSQESELETDPELALTKTRLEEGL